MGAFYGAVYLRTQEREPIREVLECLAQKQKMRFLLAPVLQGWIGVYPEMHGQDESVSRAIAKKTSCDVLHVLMHHDDVLCYFFYRGGRLVDQFNSCPEYFDDAVSSRTKKKLQGKPELLAHLLRDSPQLGLLRKLVRTPNDEQPVFASEMVAQFAELLQLPNALTSYEYLSQGETEDIEEWDKFLHVPPVDRTEEYAKEARIQTQERRLKKEMMLLLSQAGTGKGLQLTMPHMCPDREGSGFWVCWANGIIKGKCSLERYAHPWQDSPQPVGIKFPSSISNLRPSLSGRMLAVGHAFGTWKAKLWDMDKRKLILEHAHTGAVSWADFTPDERTFVSRSDEEVIATSLGRRQKSATFPVAGGGGDAALHPSGKFLVVDMQDHIGILDLKSGQVRSPLRLGEQQDHTRLHQALGQRINEVVAKVDFSVLAKRMKKALKDIEPDAAKIEAQVQQNIDNIKKQFSKFSTAESSIQGSEHPSVMEFSPDGTLLFCGTTAGCRVYEWTGVMQAGEQMPPPIFAAASERNPANTLLGSPSNDGYVYALAFDAQARRLLFGGLAGTIEYLDINSGLSGTFLDIPGRPVIQQLCLNRDRSALCCIARPYFFDRGVRCNTTILQIWNYPEMVSSLRGRH